MEEDARHFAECPRYDQLWASVDRLMDAAGLPPAVRRWFVLYGPESAAYKRDRYDTVVWIWAATVAVMLRARRDYRQAAETRQVTSPAQMIAAVKTILREAAGAEYAAACLWMVPGGEHGGQYGRRQAQSEQRWEQRWRGLAQQHRARMVWMDEAAFDRGAAVRTLEHYAQRAR